MEEMKYKDMIELIYQAEEKTLDEKIKDINIDKLIENTSKPNDLNKALEKIEENYSIKISQYTKDFYKQGFIDGVNLMINCIKQ